MILVKFPSRERPLKFIQTLREWVILAENITDIHFLFSFDKDDDSMLSIRSEIEDMGIHATLVYGTSACKIHAINRDIEHVKHWDILLVVSDDMWPTQRGWDSSIRHAFATHFQDTDGCVWFFDGKQKDICTLPLMGRKYYQRFGYVYNPEYTSVFADDEQTAVARRLGKLHYIDTPICLHRHPANYSDVVPDGLHRKNETQEIWDMDRSIYISRKAQGFPA